MTQKLDTLNYVKFHPGSSNQQIAEGIGVDAKRASAMSSYLEAVGCLTSVPDKSMPGKGCKRRLYTLNSFTPTKAYKPKFKQKKTIENEKLAKKQQRQLALELQNATPAPAATADIVTPIEREMLTAPPIESSMEPSGIEGLVDQLAQAIAQQLMPRLYHYLLQGLPLVPSLPAPVLNRTTLDDPLPAIDNTYTPKPAARVKLPKVLVLGLLANQTGHIQAEYHQVFDLHFWNTSEGTERLRSITRRADMGFIHINHNGHHTQDILREAGIPFKLVGGGMTQMRQFLQDYFIELKSKEAPQ